MNLDSNENCELIDFIKNKKILKEITYPSQLLYFFSKSIKIALVNTYKEQGNINFSLNCVGIIGCIFRIIYNYSLNLKLAIFTCERGVLLFNEYINISKSYNSDKINIMDIKQFIIGKSIGPIVLQSGKTLVHKYNNLLILIDQFICDLFIKIIKDKTIKLHDVSFYIEYLIRILSPPLIELFNKNLNVYIEEELLILKNTEVEHLLEKINYLKIKFEIFILLCEKKTIEFALANIKKLVENNYNINKLIIEFNEDENIKDSFYFKEIIKNI